MIFSRFSKSILASVVLLLSISNSALTTGNSATGSFTISLEGYGLTGALTDVTGHQSGVKLLMSIDQTFSTTTGILHIVGNGVWNGETTDTIVAGSIDDVTGSVHACVQFICQDTAFAGSGNWTGTVAVSYGSPQGSGTFQITLIFPNLNPPSTFPVSGNWTSSLNI
jgi:hypothetical protein